MAVKYPMEHVGRIWSHIYGKGQLSTFKKEHPVLLTEAPLNPYKNRFWKYFWKYIFLKYLKENERRKSSGRTTGIVLDIGDGVAHSGLLFYLFLKN